jgi:hypothetical protein
MSRIVVLKSVAASAITFLALVTGDSPATLGTGKLLSEAQARIGRPLTPMSYAGVARRTTRRAYGAGVAAGAYYAAPPAYYAPGAGCVQVVDAYGRITYRCR